MDEHGQQEEAAIQRLCDLSDQIDAARDANRFRQAVGLMLEQVRLFKIQATLSEDEKEAMEPLIQSALEEIEEMRGKVQREKEEEVKEEASKRKENDTRDPATGGADYGAPPQTTTMRRRRVKTRSSKLIETRFRRKCSRRRHRR